MNIIIIGFGSIGQRHYKNLCRLGYDNLSVYDIDQKKIDKMKCNIVKELNLKTLKQFDVAFICSPTYLHIKTSILCAQAGCHLFIEKPLSHSMSEIETLQKICQKKKLINMIGCNLRFHPCLKFVKKYLGNNKLGKIYSINHEFGYYLPRWRPHQDYRKNYSSKKKQGGGIILDDIHEFDLLFWFNEFNMVKESKFIFGKNSNLEIETEDICIASFKFNNKVLGLVRCDYLQKDHSRNLKIIGENGNIEWDFKEDIVWLINDRQKKNVFEIKNFDPNDGFIDELKYFFSCLSKGEETFNNIKRAKYILQYCTKRK